MTGLAAHVAAQQQGVDTFEEARSVETEMEGVEGGFEWESHGGYTVIPLVLSDIEGLRTDASLWVHFRYSWSWRVFSYSSDVWALGH